MLYLTADCTDKRRFPEEIYFRTLFGIFRKVTRGYRGGVRNCRKKAQKPQKWNEVYRCAGYWMRDGEENINRE